MIDITIRYTKKGKTPGVFIVNPDYFIEVTGESFTEALSKFSLAVIQLREQIIEREEFEKVIKDHDIPF